MNDKKINIKTNNINSSLKLGKSPLRIKTKAYSSDGKQLLLEILAVNNSQNVITSLVIETKEFMMEPVAFWGGFATGAVTILMNQGPEYS